MVAFMRLKTTGKSVNFQAQKVAACAYRRWSFTRDSNYKSLTGKALVFRIVGRLCGVGVVAHGGSDVLMKKYIYPTIR